jgi:hypothetical protein
MARIDADALQDPVNIYLTASLAVAREVEALLTSRGVDYAVQVEPLGRTTLFGSLRHAAAFYVSAGQASYCLSVLRETDLRNGIVESHG